MKSFIFLFFFLPSFGYSQKEAIGKVAVHICSTSIENDEDFVFSITLYNKSDTSIFISPNPVISSVVGGFGDILIQIERLDSSCYKVLDIDENPIGVRFYNYLKEITAEGSVSHKIDSRSFGFMKKGMYRMKAYYNFNYLSKKNICESNYIYFEVKKYVSLKAPNLFREKLK